MSGEQTTLANILAALVLKGDETVEAAIARALNAIGWVVKSVRVEPVGDAIEGGEVTVTVSNDGRDVLATGRLPKTELQRVEAQAEAGTGEETEGE